MAHFPVTLKWRRYFPVSLSRFAAVIMHAVIPSQQKWNGSLQFEAEPFKNKIEKSSACKIWPWKPLTYYIYLQIFSTDLHWSQKWSLESLKWQKSANRRKSLISVWAYNTMGHRPKAWEEKHTKACSVTNTPKLPFTIYSPVSFPSGHNQTELGQLGSFLCLLSQGYWCGWTLDRAGLETRGKKRRKKH